MPRSHHRRRPETPFFVPHVKVWLEANGRYAFGPGLSDILQAVDRAGSIKHAPRHVHKSYRHVWQRIQEAEVALGQPLVQTQVGGTGTQRSSLTEAARRLLASFLALRGRMLQLVEEEFSRHVLFRLAWDIPNSNPRRCLP
jgi:molybdate transport system regulatory protein